MCLRESCFSDSWKVSSAVRVSKNVRERSLAKNYHPAQGRSHSGERAGGHGLLHFNFRTKKGPTVSVSHVRDIVLFGCSGIIGKFHNFTINATFFERFIAAFHFF